MIYDKIITTVTIIDYELVIIDFETTSEKKTLSITKIMFKNYNYVFTGRLVPFLIVCFYQLFFLFSVSFYL